MIKFLINVLSLKKLIKLIIYFLYLFHLINIHNLFFHKTQRFYIDDYLLMLVMGIEIKGIFNINNSPNTDAPERVITKLAFE